MPYALFFYSYALTIATVVALTGFAALYVRHRRRLHLYVTFLFALYLIDITLLWMVESIPEFAVHFTQARGEQPYLYTLFSTIMLLAYRSILGDLLDYPVSNHEAALWVLCLVGIVAEWEVRNDLYSVAVELVFPNALRIWTVASGLFIYAHQRGLVERARGRSALLLIAVFCTMEALEFTFPSASVRSIPLEIMGFVFTGAGLVYLGAQLRITHQRTEGLQPLRAAQAYGLTRREEDLLGLLIRHKTNREIGEELGISIGTVKTHVRHIYEKMDVNSREELCAAVMRVSR